MKDFLIGSLLALAYFVLGKLSSSFGVVSSIIHVNIFAPEGVALAAVLLFGRRVVWGIFVGQTLYALSNGLDFFIASFIGFSNTIEALLALYFVKRWRINLHFENLQSVLRFFALVAFILQPWSALVGNTILLIGGESPLEHFWIFVSSWYFGNLVAQLIITPMLLLLYWSYKRDELHLWKLLVTILFFTVGLYLLVVVFHLENMALLLSITIVALFVISYRFGVVYGAISINVISMMMIMLTQTGMEVFTHQSRFDNIVNLNFYMLAHVFIFYIHQAMYQEKENLLLQLKQINTTLEKKVKEEVEKNREKEKFLMYQSRLAQMGEIINMIAHQWRQPLNSLSIMVQTIAIKFNKGALSKEELGTIERNIITQIDYMSNTIDSFRNFFRPEKRAVVFDLRKVLSQVLKMSKLEIEKNGINFIYHQNVEVFLKGYPNELGQALLNIINNAKDQFLQKETEIKRISLEVTSEQGSALIKVADTAGGIDESIKERIFEPYFSTKEGRNGTGLGLYITKMIVEEHMGGEISVENSAHGAVFVIRLKESIDADISNE